MVKTKNKTGLELDWNIFSCQVNKLKGKNVFNLSLSLKFCCFTFLLGSICLFNWDDCFFTSLTAAFTIGGSRRQLWKTALTRDQKGDRGPQVFLQNSEGKEYGGKIINTNLHGCRTWRVSFYLLSKGDCNSLHLSPGLRRSSSFTLNLICFWNSS